MCRRGGGAGRRQRVGWGGVKEALRRASIKRAEAEERSGVAAALARRHPGAGEASGGPGGRGGARRERERGGISQPLGRRRR